MKRVFCLFLSICILAIFTPVNVSATMSSNQYYTLEEQAIIADNFRRHDTFIFDNFTADKNLRYWTLVNNIKDKPDKSESDNQNKFLYVVLDLASRMLDEQPDEEDYVRMLTNLIMMQKMDLSTEIIDQKRYDNDKSILEYGLDFLDIAASFLGFSGITGDYGPIVDSLTNGFTLSIKTAEEAQYLEMVLRDYSQSSLFLKAVADHAREEQMRIAAQMMLKAVDDALPAQLDYLHNNLDNLSKFTHDFYINNVFFTALKKTESYASSNLVKVFADEASSFFSKLSPAMKAAFKLTIIAGDFTFGTTNTYRDYQEMRAMAEISEALTVATRRIIIPEHNQAGVISQVNAKCYLYKMLLTTHIRGEYLLHKLVTEDGNVAVYIKELVQKLLHTSQDEDAMYQTTQSTIVKYYNILCEIDNLKREQYLPRIDHIQKYYQGNLEGEYLFYYDEARKLTNMVYKYGDQEIQYQYTYDSSSRLIRTDINTWSAPMSTYTYNDDGQVESWTFVDELQTDFTCSYDSNGRLIEVRSDDGIEQSHYIYYYDSEGRISKIETTVSPSGQTWWQEYLYASDGLLFSTTNHFQNTSTRTTYHYEYMPFTVMVDETHGTKSIAMTDIMGHEIFSIFLGAVTLTQDSQGYLSSAASGDVEFVFHYGYISSHKAPAFEKTEDYDDPNNYSINRIDQSVFSGEKLMATIYYDLVSLEGADGSIFTINELIEDDYVAFMKSYRDLDYTTMISGLSGGGGFFATAEADVTHFSSDFISIKMKTNVLMGARPIADCYGLSFSLKNGRKLDLSICLGMESQNIVNKFASETYQYLLKEYPEADAYDIYQRLQTYEPSDFSYYLSGYEGQIILIYPTYSILSGNYGCIEVPTTLCCS